MKRNTLPPDGTEHPIARRRKELGMTRLDLARLTGANRNYLADVELRRSSPTERWLRRVSVHLQCEPSDLLDESVPEAV